MIVTRKIALRIALIVIAAVILQTSFFSYLSILGATPYLVPVVIVALGLLGGAVVGAVSGFAAGFLLDSLLLQTLGVSSLVLLSIGYLAGRYREGFEFKGLGVPALLAGGFTLLGDDGLRRDRARPRRRCRGQPARRPRDLRPVPARDPASASRSTRSVTACCARPSSTTSRSRAPRKRRLRLRRLRTPCRGTQVAGHGESRRVPVHGGVG